MGQDLGVCVTDAEQGQDLCAPGSELPVSLPVTSVMWETHACLLSLNWVVCFHHHFPAPSTKMQ